MMQNKVLGLLGITAKSGGLVSGTDICIELIEKKKAKLIIIASDCSEKTKKEFNFIAEKYNIPILEFGTIQSISKAIGKQNRAVMVIKNKNLSNEIRKIICGGEAIG